MLEIPKIVSIPSELYPTLLRISFPTLMFFPLYIEIPADNDDSIPLIISTEEVPIPIIPKNPTWGAFIIFFEAANFPTDS